MRSTLLYLVACLATAATPLISTPPSAEDARTSGPATDFPGWSTEYEGRPLRQQPLDEREAALALRFPGQVACFTDGDRQFIMRWIAEPTHELHAARTCFRSRGFTITPQHARIDERGRLWGRFLATRDDTRQLVSEVIQDDAGRSWPDASAWYWDQVLQEHPGPWWSVVVVEAVETP